MPTALAIRGLRAYGLPEHQERIEKRVAAARDWSLKSEPQNTEDRVFRLLDLHAAGASRNDIQQAAQGLAATQRSDGGWGQTASMANDAYATGTALAVLKIAADIPATDRVYRRGVAYLMKIQRDDGSWLVKSRSFPVQPYYESGFPHGRDQFISSAATGWAATALTLTLEKMS